MTFEMKLMEEKEESFEAGLAQGLEQGKIKAAEERRLLEKEIEELKSRIAELEQNNHNA